MRQSTLLRVPRPLRGLLLDLRRALCHTLGLSDRHGSFATAQDDARFLEWAFAVRCRTRQRRMHLAHFAGFAF